MTDSVQPAPSIDEVAPGELSSVLEEFASVIAHELATPLAVVQGAAITLLEVDGLDEERRRDLLRAVRRNSDLAVLLLRRLGLARDIEAGEVQLSPASLDLGTLVRESVDDLRTVILGDHEVTLTVAGPCPLEADEIALREILLNLLSNAAKYSDRGAAIDLTVGADAGRVHLAVRNHGSGVTPGDTELIFDKFHQGDVSSPGAGLGLYISRGLARAHGGDIAVRPATDRGSEFLLTLPA